MIKSSIRICKRILFGITNLNPRAEFPRTANSVVTVLMAFIFPSWRPSLSLLTPCGAPISALGGLSRGKTVRPTRCAAAVKVHRSLRGTFPPHAQLCLPGFALPKRQDLPSGGADRKVTIQVPPEAHIQQASGAGLARQNMVGHQ